MSVALSQQRYTCALAAQQTVLAIPRGIPIVHAGPGCSQKAHAFLSLGAGYQGEGYAGGNSVSCTNASEQEVVYGGEKRLEQLIESSLKVVDGDLFVVLTGCTSDLIGDDSLKIASQFRDAGAPVVGVETSGFKGTNYYGHEAVVKAIVKQLVGDRKAEVKKGLVNVFSLVPYQNPFWRGDLETIKQLLELLGLQVNILFGYGSEGLKEWKTIPDAEFNLLLSPWVGYNIVEFLQNTYGTPFLHLPVVPVGGIQTSHFLRQVASFAGIPGTLTEAVIQKEEQRYYDFFLSATDFLTEFHDVIPNTFFTVSDSSYAIGLGGFLVNELGMTPGGVYLTDEPKAAFLPVIQKALADQGPEFTNVVFENDGSKIQADIKERLPKHQKAWIFGSTWEKFFAIDNDQAYSFLSLPLNETFILTKSYVGYNGGLRLLEEAADKVFDSRRAVSSRNKLSD